MRLKIPLCHLDKIEPVENIDDVIYEYLPTFLYKGSGKISSEFICPTCKGIVRDPLLCQECDILYCELCSKPDK